MKKPRIELSLHGEHVAEIIAWLRRKYEVTILSERMPDASVPIEDTEYWQTMEKNRVGNLLAGARLKAGLTQAQLAERVGIRQSMVSDYERGRRGYSDDMAKRLSRALKVREEHLRYRSNRSAGK